MAEEKKGFNFKKKPESQPEEVEAKKEVRPIMQLAKPVKKAAPITKAASPKRKDTLVLFGDGTFKIFSENVKKEWFAKGTRFYSEK